MNNVVQLVLLVVVAFGDTIVSVIIMNELIKRKKNINKWINIFNEGIIMSVIILIPTSNYLFSYLAIFITGLGFQIKQPFVCQSAH